MNARDTILSSIRASLGVTGAEAPRRKVVADRLASHPAGVVPSRGQLPPKERLALFMKMLEGAAGTVQAVASTDEVPAAVGAFLRRHNLPLAVRRGGDEKLSAIPWSNEPSLEVSVGPSDGKQLASVSRAFGAVAETGTLVMTSGPEHPVTLNLLPDTHVVVLREADIVGGYEDVWARLRERYGKNGMPRTVNTITGPSRTGDIEQTIELGAHGPRRMHIVVVRE